jgi:TolB-like protein/predicted TPR repeat methyltransferase
MSANQDQSHFADGITEEILNRLDQSTRLRVIARTSSFAFRGKPQDIREIASQLNVTHVLEGSVRRSGDDIRITAQLIAAADNAQLWSATFDRSPGDLLAVQDEIAAAVATALRVTLDDAQLTGEAPVKPEAYETFLQARFFFNRRAPGDIERAVRYYQDALAIDPGFGRGWAALAGAYNLLRMRDRQSPERWLQLQGEAAHRAVELAPGLAVAHARLGQYYYSAADRQNGNAHFQTAMTLDSNDPLVMGFAGDRAIRHGNLDEVVEIWRQLVEQNPLSATDRGNLAHFLAAAGHLDEAATEYRRTLELNPDARWYVQFELARVLVRQRNYEQTIAEVLQLPPGEPRDSGMAILHEVPGYEAEADAALRRLAALPLDLESIRLAELYVSRGMKEEAFASLKAVFDALARSPESSYWASTQAHELQMEMIQSSYLEPLRADPRWAALMAEPQRP